MSRLKQLGKDSLIYGIGGVAAKGIGFFLLPIYTRIFTPLEYGTIEMLAVMSSFLSAFLVMGMDSAQSFFFFARKDRGKAEQAKLVSAILQWRLTWGVVVVLVATACAPLLNAWLFDGRLTWHYFAFAFAGSLFSQVMGQSVEIFRLLYRPWPYMAIMLTHTVFSAALVVTLVLVYDWGILAFIVGSMSASFVVAGIGWYLVRDYLDFGELHTGWWPLLLRFGAPLLPAGLAMYGMNTSGRWFLQYYHGAESLGLYAVGARFALLLALAVEVFRKAWWPMAMDSMHSDDGPETFRMIARLYMGLGVAALVVLTLLSPWLVRFLTGPEFQNSWPIIGVLAWQSLFYGFFLVASAGIWRAEKTYLTVYLMGGAVALNIMLNMTLVPPFGGMGAALATALTFFVWICAAMHVSDRLWPVRFPITVLGAQIAVGVVVVAWLITGHADQPIPLQFVVATTVAVLLLYFSVDHAQRSRWLHAWTNR